MSGRSKHGRWFLGIWQIETWVVPYLLYKRRRLVEVSGRLKHTWAVPYVVPYLLYKRRRLVE
jgi:hypothetical protein